MGLVSSINSTQVESYSDQAAHPDDPNAVAKPLQPAYAPNPTTSAPPTAPPAPYLCQQRPLFYHTSSPFNPSFSTHGTHGADAPDLMPDLYSSSVTSTQPVPSLPFQPNAPLPPNTGSFHAHTHTHMGYYPLEMGSVHATGVVLSRAVRVLEATPPPYLLMPEHPNTLPGTPRRPPPPVPPNTAHAHRFDPNVPRYPGINKMQQSADMVAGREVSVEAQRIGGGPRPPTVG